MHSPLPPTNPELSGRSATFTGEILPNNIDPTSESVKLSIAQDVMKQNASQLDELAAYGIPTEEIAEPRYTYAPTWLKSKGSSTSFSGAGAIDRILIHPYARE